MNEARWQLAHGADALTELRESLRLYEQVPRINEVHPVGMPEPIEGGLQIPVCAHDEANERSHTFWYPAQDNEVVHASTVQTHANLILSAGWN